MNTLRIIFLVNFVTVCLLLDSCRNQNSTGSVCEFKEIKNLFIVENSHAEVDTSYSHYVLLKEFSRECLDSLRLLNIVTKYMDTIKYGRPINMLHIYNSDKHFIKGEVSQDWEKVNRDCLVTIWIDEKNKTPEKFIFFNENGKVSYEGNQWMPNQH